MAQMIGTRATVFGTFDTMYRLSAPLADCYPDWRNVFVQLRDNGERAIMRARAYETEHAGVWAPVPPQQGSSWIACFQPLSARDLAMADAEIAAAHGNWSA
jgi:hypothetical protein